VFCRIVVSGCELGCRICRFLVCSGGSAATGTIGIGLLGASKARLDENSSGCRKA